MKWTITNILYVFFACLLVTGIFHQCGLKWMGNTFAVIDGVLISIVFLKYLNGDHLK